MVEFGRLEGGLRMPSFASESSVASSVGEEVATAVGAPPALSPVKVAAAVCVFWLGHAAARGGGGEGNGVQCGEEDWRRASRPLRGCSSEQVRVRVLEVKGGGLAPWRCACGEGRLSRRPRLCTFFITVTEPRAERRGEATVRVCMRTSAECGNRKT